MQSRFLLTVLLLYLLTAFTTVAQPPRLKADSLLEAGDYKGAIAGYKTWIGKKPGDARISYNLACALALDSQREEAIRYLQQSIVEEKGEPYLMTLGDPDLRSLHSDRSWAQIQDEILDRYQTWSKHPLKDKAYLMFLLNLRANDQYWREEALTAEKKWGRESPQARRCWVAQHAADSLNLILLEQQIAAKGWPRISVVGAQAASAAFLVVQHSDLVHMKKYLPVLKQLSESGEALRQSYALLYDRVEVSEGRPQLYGSQVFYDEKKKAWALYPIADEVSLTERRSKMGLQPMGEYVANWNIRYAPKFANGMGVLPDTVFRRSANIIYLKTGFYRTQLGAYPSGWVMRHEYSRECTQFAHVENISGRRAALADEPSHPEFAGSWSIIAKNRERMGGGVLPLGSAFTVECSYFLLDSTNPKAEFAVYFKEARSRYKNDLNLRIRQDGSFEINCDAGDPALGTVDFRSDSFHASFARAIGRSTQYHKELTGRIPAHQPRVWHQMSVAYKDHQFRCWLDGRYLGKLETIMTTTYAAFRGITPFAICDITAATADDTIDLSQFLKNRRLTTHSIRFDVNRAEVKPESFHLLEELAGWLQENRTARLEIGGHTDASGNVAANLTLSQQRADAIRAVLIQYGIPPDRLLSRGFGAGQPLQPNITDQNRAANRRVEFVLL